MRRRRCPCDTHTHSGADCNPHAYAYAYPDLPPPRLLPTPIPTPTPTARSYLGDILPWFSDPPDELHAQAADRLLEVYLVDAAVGDALARLPWVADGIADLEADISAAEARAAAGRHWAKLASGVPHI